MNQDGKLSERVFAAFVGIMPAMIIAAVLWWADSRAADARNDAAIARIERRLDTVELEAREARRAAAEDRQKLAELSSDIRNLLRSTSRIEVLLDKVMGPRRAGDGP